MSIPVRRFPSARSSQHRTLKLLTCMQVFTTMLGDKLKGASMSTNRSNAGRAQILSTVIRALPPLVSSGRRRSLSGAKKELRFD
jgi:hypothetical protein